MWLIVPNPSISSELASPQDLQLFNKMLTPLSCRHLPHNIPITIKCFNFEQHTTN